MINFQNTQYVHSAYYKKDLIQDHRFQFAFVGRSNVGKSSLINTLTLRKKLALISKTPGKTKTINYFDLDNQLYLVDLPGYGYASVAKTMKSHWEKAIEFYLLNTDQLITTFLLWDYQVSPHKNDLVMLEWYLYHKLPFSIILTKADKLSRPKRQKKLQEIKDKLQFEFPMIEFSAKTKLGVEQLRKYIQYKWEEIR